MPPSERVSTRESNAFIWIVVVAVFLGIGGFGLSLRSIHSRVEITVRSAQSRYSGDAAEALMSLLESDSATYREKNRAIWALGQIGDKRALPVLQRLDTGEVQKTPYDPSQYIVLYSVRKAIKQIQSDFSMTRWMYTGLRQNQNSP
jgi:hypothetical protein